MQTDKNVNSLYVLLNADRPLSVWLLPKPLNIPNPDVHRIICVQKDIAATSCFMTTMLSVSCWRSITWQRCCSHYIVSNSLRPAFYFPRSKYIQLQRIFPLEALRKPTENRGVVENIVYILMKSTL